MNKSLVEIVVETLEAVGLHAQRAFPGGRTPAIDCLETTVGIKEVDRAAGTATVKVSVLTPANLGAALCEDEGLYICSLLRNIGGACRQGEAIYDARGDFFCVPVEATFTGYEALDGWSNPAPAPAPTYTVKVENVVLEHVAAFDAECTVDTSDLSAGQKYWTFRLEEIIPLDRQESIIPAEPFSIAVAKEYGADVYSGCKITGRKRLFREDGLHHIWEGTADGMTAVS